MFPSLGFLATRLFSHPFFASHRCVIWCPDLLSSLVLLLLELPVPSHLSPYMHAMGVHQPNICIRSVGFMSAAASPHTPYPLALDIPIIILTPSFHVSLFLVLPVA